MGKWAKYSKSLYDPRFERDPLFSAWIQKTPDNLINEGKSEAYCKICRSTIRPKRSDLLAHLNTDSHRKAVKALPSKEQPQLEKFGFQGNSEKNEKITDMKMSVCVACHSSTKSVDHFGETVRDLGKGSALETLRLHRTKCSKIIERVIAPSLLEEIVEDLGDRFYSMICDGGTDIGTNKQLALCMRFYSVKHKRMVTHALGLIESSSQTADKLYEVFVAFVAALGLRLDRLMALGTDGGLNFCGAHHSLYALLKKDIPHLMIVRCVCHSLDKCASYSSKEFPPVLEYLIRETRNWFSHSSNRKAKYAEQYQELFAVEPPLLVKLAATRWLSFYGAVNTHLQQYPALKKHFNLVAASSDTCPMAVSLADMHNDDRNLLMLTFLKPVLRELTQVNVIFQHTYADISKVYSDLRTFVFSVAQRVIRPEALRQGGPGMLRTTELQALKNALARQDSLKPLDLVNYPDSFRTLALKLEQEGLLSKEKIREVKSFCANFLVKLSKELTERLPDCIAEIEKLRNLAPAQVLSKRGRPLFNFLPLNLIPHNFDTDVLDGQWTTLGALNFRDICPNEEDTLETIDIVKFWSCCHELKNAGGERSFQEIAFVALSLLSLPLSNAVVERVFSIMSIVKSKLRNKMSTRMLGAILIVRLYLKVFKQCCVDFEPTEGILRRFNSRTMYGAARPRPTEGGVARVGEAEEVDDPDIVEFEDNEEAIEAVLDFVEEGDVNALFG